jgi:hypothetical protein
MAEAKPGRCRTAFSGTFLRFDGADPERVRVSAGHRPYTFFGHVVPARATWVFVRDDKVPGRWAPL